VLIRGATLQGIAEGRITALYRRWKRPRVKTGSTLRTSIGLLHVERVDPVRVEDVGAAEARAAGHASRDELLAELARHADGPLYRIAIRLGGADPRLALRRTHPHEKEVAQLDARVARMGSRSASGPWASAILELIAKRPGVRAADLARQLGMETARFKTRVRELKELATERSLSAT
jgi:hypothetical protein